MYDPSQAPSSQSQTIAPPPPVPPGPPGSTPYQQPQPKKRRGLIIGIVAVLLLICLPLTCLGGFAGFGLMDASNTREVVVTAEVHYDLATQSVESAQTRLEVADPDPATLKRVAEEATADLRTARDELTTARAIIDPLDESEGKAAYLASLDAATEALGALEQIMDALVGTSDLVDRLGTAAAATETGSDALSAAIKAGNKSEYSTMRKKAQDASTRFAEAATVFDLAHDSDPSAGLDQTAVYIRVLQKQADLVRAMADDGAAKRVSAYNKKIKELKKLSADIEDMEEPAIIADPQWFANRVAELGTAVEEAGAEADAKHLAALRAFGMAD